MEQRVDLWHQLLVFPLGGPTDRRQASCGRIAIQPPANPVATRFVGDRFGLDQFQPTIGRQQSHFLQSSISRITLDFRELFGVYQACPSRLADKGIFVIESLQANIAAYAGVVPQRISSSLGCALADESGGGCLLSGFSLVGCWFIRNAAEPPQSSLAMDGIAAIDPVG